MIPWGRGKKRAGGQDSGAPTPGRAASALGGGRKHLPPPGLCERLGRRVDSREEEVQEFFRRVRKAGVRRPRLGAC